MMTESKLLHEFRTYFDDRMNRLEDKIDAKFSTVCDRCQNAPSFREKFKTLYTHIYSLWGFIAAIGSIAIVFLLGLVKP